MKKDEELKVEERLSAKYNAKALFAKHGAVVEARDNAFKSFFSQKGKVYIINFKPTGEFPIPGPEAGAKVFRRGLQTVYPEGVKAISIKEVLYEGKGKPVATDQIYYLRYADTEGQKYSITSSKKEGDVYIDAVITTSQDSPLGPPRSRSKKRGNRVKFIIVSKVKES